MQEEIKTEQKRKVFATDYDSTASVKSVIIAVISLMLTACLAGILYFLGDDFGLLCSSVVQLFIVAVFGVIGVTVYARSKPSKLTDEFCSILWCCGIITVTAALFSLNYLPSNIGNPDIYSDVYFWPLLFIAATAFLSGIVFKTVSPLFLYYSMILIVSSDCFASEFSVLNIPVAHFFMLPGIGLAIVRSFRKDDLLKRTTQALAGVYVLLGFTTAAFYYTFFSAFIALTASVLLVGVCVSMRIKISDENIRQVYQPKGKKVRVIIASVLVLLQMSFVLYLRSNPEKFRREECEGIFEIERIEIIGNTTANVYLKSSLDAKNKRYVVFSPSDESETLAQGNIEGVSEMYFTNKVPLAVYEGYVSAAYFDGEPIEYQNDYPLETQSDAEDKIYTEKDWDSAKAYAKVFDGVIQDVTIEIEGNSELEIFVYEDEENYWMNYFD